MSTKQPTVNAKQLIKVLEQKGFYFSRQSGTDAEWIETGKELGRQIPSPKGKLMYA